MLMISPEQMEQWDSDYDRLELDDKISRVSFLMHCAAMWGFDQALSVMDVMHCSDPSSSVMNVLRESGVVSE